MTYDEDLPYIPRVYTGRQYQDSNEIDEQTRNLIVEIWHNNSELNATDISRELIRAGIPVSETTVQSVLDQFT